MRLSRKQWNYIIIISSLAMISLLNIFKPEMTQNLIPDHFKIESMQIGNKSLKLENDVYICSSNITQSCEDFAQAWQELRIEKLVKPPKKIDLNVRGEEIKLDITIYLYNYMEKYVLKEPQKWIFYPSGYIQDSDNTWYKVPDLLKEK